VRGDQGHLRRYPLDHRASGALAVAGIKKYVAREGLQGQVLVAIDSGANVNFDRLRHVAERAELGEQREA
jgi:threonine dehydratase